LSDKEKRLALFWMVKNAEELVEKVQKGENSEEIVNYIKQKIFLLKLNSGDVNKLNYMLSLLKN
jgi:hypothetical protein